jgi:membrane-associated phospholipid phosphatase
MAALTLWTVVILLATVGISMTMALGLGSWSGGLLSQIPMRVAVLCAAAVALILLGGLWRVRPIANADATVVEKLANSRGDELVMLMKAFTTIGDAIPSLVIAGMLALLVHQQGHHRILCFALPLLVLVELLFQNGMGSVFHDFTIGRLSPGTPEGGIGTIPSGSVARLSSLFLAAACMWWSTDERGGRRLVGIGSCLLVLQTVSRLYLGRHLVADIVGGLLLGLLLTLVFVSLVQFVGRSPQQQAVTGSSGRRPTMEPG